MRAARTIDAVRADVSHWKAAGLTVGLVPTMGALHEGHLSLIDRSRSMADRTIASLFVNPTQFGPGEDFDKYPRQEAQDLAMLEARGCDVAFIPATEEIYPSGGAAATRIIVTGLTEGLCGAHRPGHFDGVATIVMKLLMITQPDVAVFGEKDYQQLQVIKRMVRDLDVPVAIQGAPIVREPDGLAMSSRNAYLNPALRGTAASLFRILSATAADLRRGTGVAAALKGAKTS